MYFVKFLYIFLPMLVFGAESSKKEKKQKEFETELFKSAKSFFEDATDKNKRHTDGKITIMALEEWQGICLKFYQETLEGNAKNYLTNLDKNQKDLKKIAYFLKSFFEECINVSIIQEKNAKYQSSYASCMDILEDFLHPEKSKN